MQTIFMLLSMVMGAGPSTAPSGKPNSPSGAAWLTLICGIASWLFLPMIASFIGIIIGKGELKAIEQGRSPQAGEAITKIGYYVSIANIVLAVLGTCFSFAIFALIWGGVIAGVGGLAIFGELANSMP